MERERYESLNGLRAIAAICILLMHYYLNLSEETKTVLSDSSFLYGTVLTSIGAIVKLFFIISSFSMCCGYFSRFNVENGKCQFDVERFYSKRYSRIWPFFALLVILDVAASPSLSSLFEGFADLTLAFNFLPMSLHVIGVGWFIGLVFVFYMVFPWFVYLLQNKRRAWFSMVISILFCLFLDYYSKSILPKDSYVNSLLYTNAICNFPFFMAGGLIYLYRKALSKERFKYVWLLMGVAAIAIQLSFNPEKIFGNHFLFWLLIFSLMLLYALTGGIQFGNFKLLDNKVMRFISDISMEIYLCHMLMFRAIEGLHVERIISNPHLLYWGTSIAGLGVSILFSWFVKYKLFKWIGITSKS